MMDIMIKAPGDGLAANQDGILKQIITLVIVNNLNGNGVKPAVTNIPNHAKKPPPVVNFSLKLSEYS